MTSSDIKISKALSYVLRHGAVKEGLKIDQEGFINVSELLNNKMFKGITKEKLKQVVDTNDKKRYYLEEVAGELKIRANQGHTIKAVDNVELKKITSVHDVPSVIHGTYRKHLDSILKDGLNKMERNLIHFAIGDHGGVVSGMRNGCDMVIVIDLQLCLDDGLEFFLSTNDVALTNGVDGVLTKKYFSKIVDRRGMTIWQR